MTPEAIATAAALRCRTPRASRLARSLVWLAATVAHLPGLTAVQFVARMAETAAERPEPLRSDEARAVAAELRSCGGCGTSRTARRRPPRRGRREHDGPIRRLVPARRRREKAST